jgi:hypothetical protein
MISIKKRKKSNTKIYCENCRHLKIEDLLPFNYCREPSNIYTVESHLSYVVGFLRGPEELNKDNNCKYFKPTLMYRIKNAVKSWINYEL